jgi:hypothetical protein
MPCPGAQSKVEGLGSTRNFAAVEQFLTHQLDALEILAFELVKAHCAATSSPLTCVILYFATSVTHNRPAGRCSGMLQAVFRHYTVPDRQAENHSSTGGKCNWLGDELPDTLILVRIINSFAYHSGMKTACCLHGRAGVL